jgi:hypothetical protein
VERDTFSDASISRRICSAVIASQHRDDELSPAV